jgi:NADPH:quinone reductase-like Zn-dependent oxidoreductase
MRAVGVKRFGAEPVEINVAKPDPGPGDLLVRVEAAGLNPVDIMIASGVYGTGFQLPLVMGRDFAGRVEAVGSAVDRFAVGDAVFGQTPVPTGSYAEYVVVPQDSPVAAAPDSIDLKTAAALPTAGMTALGILDQAKVRGGESMVILGAAGGVGTFLTQLASARDVRVVAVTRGDESVRMGLFGAAVTVDTTEERLEDRLERDEYPEGVDVLVDLVSAVPTEFEANKALVHDGGVVLSTRGAAGKHGVVQSGVDEIAYVLQPSADLLATLAKEVDAGALKVSVEAEVPLEQAPQAVARNQAGGARGKTIIKL